METARFELRVPRVGLYMIRNGFANNVSGFAHPHVTASKAVSVHQTYANTSQVYMDSIKFVVIAMHRARVFVGHP